MNAKLEPLARKLGIGDILAKYPYEVSGGQKQRGGSGQSPDHRPQTGAGG